MQGVTDPNAAAGMANHGSGTVSGGLFGLGGTDILGGLFNLAIVILELAIVIGVIVGLVVFIKRYVFGGTLTIGTKTTCTKCGQVLKTGWVSCPNCGESIVSIQNGTISPQKA